MLSFVAWYLLISLLGFLTLPLAFRLFPSLADRGYTLARALGLLLWSYVFWILASLGVLRNDSGGLLLAFLLVLGLSLLASWKNLFEKPSALRAWLRANLRLVVGVELLFLLAFAAWAFVRASNPNIETAGGEKTMELAFINAIIHSPTFPPHDPWLSGYSISYYYFGYVMAAMMAEATATPGAVAHNLMTALIFALSTIGSYGLLYNLLASWKARRNPDSQQPTGSLWMPLLGPLFLLLVSNAEGLLEVFSSSGLFWNFPAGKSASSRFWSWLNITNLVDPPSKPFSLLPQRFLWWWQASRVVQDYSLSKVWHEIIDEFPAFSYLLGDLHPHVLVMPFGLMAVAAALNLFLGGWKGRADLRLFQLPIRLDGFLFSALLLGGLAFLNTWDVLVGLTLLVGGFVLGRALTSGWNRERLLDLFRLGIPLGLLAVLLYLPFYLGFSSQAGGILPNLESPTRGAQLWVMFGTLFLPLFAYLIHLLRTEKHRPNWKLGIGLALGVVLLLWAFSWLLGLLAALKLPGIVSTYLAGQGGLNQSAYFIQASLRRLSYIGGELTLLALMIPALALLLKGTPRAGQEDASQDGSRLTTAFILFLILLGGLLVLAPDYVYLRDLFVNRMNTVFKFYYQAWELFSIAAAFGVAVMLEKLKTWKGTFLFLTVALLAIFIYLAYRTGEASLAVGIVALALAVLALAGAFWFSRRDWQGLVLHAGLSLVLFVGLIYPILALNTKTNGFQLQTFIAGLESKQGLQAFSVWTLDGSRLFHEQYPDDAAAAGFLSSEPAGVLAEAVGGEYTDFARMSVYSGQPTVLGWAGHENQWGRTTELISTIPNLDCPGQPGQRTRADDIRCLYETSSWQVARTILTAYTIRYVVVGTLERSSYSVSEAKFQQNLVQIFQSGNVVVYLVP